MPDKMIEDRIKGMLNEYHKKPEWVFWTELKNARINKDFKRIDAFAISRNNIIMAYEIITSRSDFQKAITGYARRDFFIENSSEFHFVTPPGVAHYSEVPEDYGLIEADENLVPRKKAKQRLITSLPVAFVSEILNRKDERCVQDWPIFNLAGKKLTGNELLQFIQGGIDKYRSQELKRLKQELDEKYLAGLEIRDKKQRRRMKTLVTKLMEIIETL